MFDHAEAQPARDHLIQQAHRPGRRSMVARLVQGRDHRDRVHQASRRTIQRAEEGHGLREHLVHAAHPAP
jgi:hypothetical protein